MKAFTCSFKELIQTHLLKIITCFFLFLFGFHQNSIAQTAESKVDYIEQIYFSGKNKEDLNQMIYATLLTLQATQPATTSQAIQYAFLSGMRDQALNAEKSCDVEEMLATGIYAIDMNEAKAQGIPQPSAKISGQLSQVVSSTQNISSSASNLAWDSWVLSNGSINTFGASNRVAGGAYKLGAGADAANSVNTAVQEGKKLGKAFGIIKDKPCSSVPVKTIALSEHVPQQNMAGNTAGNNNSSNQNSQQTNSSSGSTTVSAKSYQNYDFVPGDTVLFADDFVADQDGEFPSHWDLSKGQAVVNNLGGKAAFALTDGNYAVVTPRMKTTHYLHDPFTLEFDYFPTAEAYGPVVFFNRMDENGNEAEVHIQFDTQGGATSGNFPNDLEGSYPGEKGDAFFNKWHHCAMIFKGGQLKCYVDQYRVLVMPNTGINPTSFGFEGIGNQDNPIIFTNVRLASGGNMNLVGKKFTESKIVTHGITFDVDKSTIKPESMGTLNMIVGVLKSNPDVKFEIDGHTDNTGDASHNMTLSQQRADAVKAQLTSMGIDASRLTTKGLGDTKPIDTNDTPSGKANNRRVEFVKM